MLSDTTANEVEPDTLPTDAELSEYAKITNTDENLLDFLKTNSQRFPLLSSIAWKLLSMPATSTPSERIFSAAGRIIEKHRTQLAPDTVDNLLVIHSACKVCRVYAETCQSSGGSGRSGWQESSQRRRAAAKKAQKNAYATCIQSFWIIM